MQLEGISGVEGFAQPAQPRGAEASRKFVVFLLGVNRFALPCERVVEIIPAVTIQPLPNAPTIVEGAINVRGAVVPVLDVATRFGAAATSLHPDQHFILAVTRGRTVALHVDRVADVAGVETGMVQPASSVPGARYVEGVVAVEDGLLIVHDLDSFLALDEVATLEAAMAGGAEPAPGSPG